VAVQAAQSNTFEAAARSNLFGLANLLHTSIIKIIGPDKRTLKATAFQKGLSASNFC
jgi:hypothetical protein